MKIEDLKINDVVHCDTEEKAVKFCKMLHELGKKWTNGLSYNDSCFWHLYKSETCYNANNGTHSDKKWFIDNYYNVIPFEQIEAKEFPLDLLSPKDFVPGVYWHFRGSDVEVKYLRSKEAMDSIARDGTFELIKECEKPTPKLVKWVPCLEVPKKFWVFKGGRWIEHTGYQVVSNANGVKVCIGTDQISSEKVYVKN